MSNVESNKLINPYGLLGIKHNQTNISELKKNYYNLSLITHPDKGGSKGDFEIVHLAYNYIKEQINNANEKETTYEKLEDEFEDFITKQEEIKPPCFYEVFKETNDWLNEFNKRFEEDSQEIKENTNGTINNPFNIGYGELMDKSEISEDYITNENKATNNQFDFQIIEFEEPEYLPNTLLNFPLDNKKITDFSETSGKLKMSDYKLTFTPLKKTEKEIKEKDYPRENIQYKPDIL